MSFAGLSKEFTTHIINRLVKADNAEDIILEISAANNIPWEEAEQILLTIKQENGRKILNRQFPMHFSIALMTFMGGLLLAGYGIYSLIAILAGNTGIPNDLTSYFMPVLEKGIDPGYAIFPAIIPYLSLVVSFLFSPFSALLLGTAMLLGSLVGMRNAWAVLLSRP